MATLQGDLRMVPTSRKSGRPALYKRLYFQVLVGLALGILIGHYYPAFGVDLKPLGDGFIKLIKMLVAPVIFLTVAIGIAKLGDLKEVGRIGLKAVIYFEVATTLALLIGLVVGNLLAPGAGMNVDPKSLDVASVTSYLDTAKAQTSVEFLMKIIPSTIVGAFAQGDILPVVFFSVLFGCAVSHAGAKSADLINVMEQISNALFKIVGYVMRLAPLGAFGAIGYTVGKFGVGTLVSLAKLVATFYVTAGLFVIVVLGAVGLWCGFNIFKLLRYLREEILICLGTSTIESVLPRLLIKLENLGCRRSVVGLVLPTGYAFNIDGVCIYATMAIVFIAQATNTHLSFFTELTVLGVLMLTTKGMSGVPGGGFVAVASTLGSVGILPVGGLALLLGVDRFLSEGRAITTMIGNAVATLVVAKWEGELDVERMKRVLDQSPPEEFDEAMLVDDRAAA